MKTVQLFALLAFVMSIGNVLADESTAKGSVTSGSETGKVIYKKGKDVKLDELLIQGQLKRPDITVVTGNAGQDGDGLLKLRENYIDRLSIDFGEEMQ